MQRAGSRQGRGLWAEKDVVSKVDARIRLGKRNEGTRLELRNFGELGDLYNPAEPRGAITPPCYGIERSSNSARYEHARMLAVQHVWPCAPCSARPTLFRRSQTL